MNLEEITKQTPCGERILGKIVEELNLIIESTNNGQDLSIDPDTYEVLYELQSLGMKLLSDDYFADAENILNNCKGKDCFELIDK